ncbi:hypothetical protein RI367_003509 [Sorochytrium milnesiophthora]
MLRLALAVALLASLVAAGIDKVDPACQHFETTYSTDCYHAFAVERNRLLSQYSGGAVDLDKKAVSPAAIDQLTDGLAKALPSFCADQCAAANQADVDSFFSQCKSNLVGSATAQLFVRTFQHMRDLRCYRDPTTHDFCTVQVMQALKPYAQSDAGLPLRAVAWPRPSSNLGEALLPEYEPKITMASDVAAPKEVLCTPCMQVNIQQSLLIAIDNALDPNGPNGNAFGPGSLAAQAGELKAQLQTVADGWNAQCGNDWITLDMLVLEVDRLDSCTTLQTAFDGGHVESLVWCATHLPQAFVGHGADFYGHHLPHTDMWKWFLADERRQYFIRCAIAANDARWLQQLAVEYDTVIQELCRSAQRSDNATDNIRHPIHYPLLRALVLQGAVEATGTLLDDCLSAHNMEAATWLLRDRKVTPGPHTGLACARRNHAGLLQLVHSIRPVCRRCFTQCWDWESSGLVVSAWKDRQPRDSFTVCDACLEWRWEQQHVPHDQEWESEDDYRVSPAELGDPDDDDEWWVDEDEEWT